MQKGRVVRVGIDYWNLRNGIKQSSPLLNKISLTDIDNIIAKKIYGMKINALLKENKKKV